MYFFKHKNNFKLFAIICALLPILNVYASPFPGLAIGEFLLFIVLLTYFYKNNFRVTITDSVAKYFYFLIFGVVISIIHILINDWIIVGNVLYEFVSKILVLLMLVIVTQKLDRTLFDKYLIYFIDIVVVFFYIQFILSIFDIRISGIASFLPLSNLNESSEFIAKQNSASRLSSFLEEPSHYCEYVYFGVLLQLFGKRNIYRLVFYTISILLTKSACGMAILAVIFMYYIWVLGNIKYRIYALLLVSLSLCAIFVIDPTLLGSVSSRFTEIFYSSTVGEVSNSGHSSYIRVIRGYIPFIEYETFNKIFGYGWGSLQSWINHHPSSNYLSITSTIPTWVNTFQLILLSTGIVGCVVFLKIFYNLYRHNSHLGKCCILIYLILMLCESVIGVSLIYTIFVAQTEKTKCLHV